MKKIMITGALGQLGRALSDYYKDNNDVTLYRYDMVEAEGAAVLDITDEAAVVDEVQAVKPDAIVNCSAYTDVNRCESEEDLAEKVNGYGPCLLARAAKAVDAVLVHVSTDYVFAGDGTRPYVEDDPTGPVSAYGRTKLIGEQRVQQEMEKYFIIRTAWLYGEGKNFVRTMLRLAGERDEVGVVYDQKGTPTSALELARMIGYLLTTEEYGIYHGTCEGETNWYEFTKEIFRQMGLATRVKPLTTAEYPTPAKRPAYSVLENKKLNSLGSYRMAQWEDALAEYLKEEKKKGAQCKK